MSALTTAQELDSLQIGSVVLDRDGDAWQRGYSGWYCTVDALNTTEQPSDSLAAILAPLTVLHTEQAVRANVAAEIRAATIQFDNSGCTPGMDYLLSEAYDKGLRVAARIAEGRQP